MNTSTLIMALTVVGLSSIPAAAQVAFSHRGRVDPATEGWLTIVNGNEPISNPVTNDLGLGVDAWNVSDPSTNFPSYLLYQQVCSEAQTDAAIARGWRLSTIVRVLAPPGSPSAPSGSSYVEYTHGNSVFSMDFGTESDGDPIVLLVTGWDDVLKRSVGPSYTLEGGSGRYHRFDLYYDPATHTAKLLVDGVTRLRDFPGYADMDIPAPGVLPHQKVRWGAVNSPGQGSANYNLVEWEIGPVSPVLDIRVSQVELCWNTVTNTDVWYQLQYRTELGPNAWVPLTSNWFRGDGSRFCTNVPVLAGQPSRLYRVVTTNSLQQP